MHRCILNIPTLVFNFALKYTVWKVQETNLGLNMNSSHQALAFTDDVNVIDIKTIERNADVLLNAYKDIGLAVNIGDTKRRSRMLLELDGN